MKADWSWKPTDADIPKPREPVKKATTKKERAKWYRKAMNAKTKYKPRSGLTSEQRRHLRDI